MPEDSTSAENTAFEFPPPPENATEEEFAAWEKARAMAGVAGTKAEIRLDHATSFLTQGKMEQVKFGPDPTANKPLVNRELNNTMYHNTSANYAHERNTMSPTTAKGQPPLEPQRTTGKIRRSKLSYKERRRQMLGKYDYSYDQLDYRLGDLNLLNNLELTEYEFDLLRDHAMRQNRPWNPIDSYENEQVLLGTLLTYPEFIPEAISYGITINDFTCFSSIATWRILESLTKEGVPINLVVFMTEAKSRGYWDALGGQPCLAELLAQVTSGINWIVHAKVVKDRTRRRDLMFAAYDIFDLAHDMNINADDEMLMKVEERIYKSFTGENYKVGFMNLTKSVDEVMETLEAKRKSDVDLFKGVRTRYKAFDELVQLTPGTLHIIAARPSMGKSALAAEFASRALTAEGKYPHVVFFSLEMTEQQILNRLLSAWSSVKLSDIMKGNVSDEEMTQLIEPKAKFLREIPMTIYECPGLTPSMIRAKCRGFKLQHQNRLDLIVVDYLQLMHADNDYGAMRAYEICEISRNLKEISVEFDCSVIALSQLSREIEKRDDKTPRLSDLRDSGTIEQDADSITFLHRPDFYTLEMDSKVDFYGQPVEEKPSRAELRISKNRNGSTGKIELLFKRSTTKFYEADTNK